MSSGENGHGVEQQASFSVAYRGQTVGEYVADMIVDGKVIVETKAVTALEPVHEAQLINYLRAGPIGLGLLINFGRKVEVVRRVV